MWSILLRGLWRKLVWIQMNNEKVLFLLRAIQCKLDFYISDILNDTQSNPRYSAVYTSRLITCLIDLLTQLGKKPHYSDIESYFKFCAYTSEEYELFESIREKESRRLANEQPTKHLRRRLDNYDEY